MNDIIIQDSCIEINNKTYDLYPITPPYSALALSSCVVRRTAIKHKNENLFQETWFQSTLSWKIPIAVLNKNRGCSQLQGFYKFPGVKKYDFIWPIEDENIWLL